MKNLKVCLDGMNLALKEGTGVATYARNLSRDLKELGATVGVVYGTKRSPSKNDLLREIAFFDEENVGRSTRIKKVITKMEDLLLAPFGGMKYEVPLSGAVIYDSFKPRMPDCDQIVISPDLFSKANRYFRNFKRLYTLRGMSYDVMHWTYPIPIQKKSSYNIYTIHDLVPLRLPYTTLDKKNRYYRMIRTIIKKADLIISVSETTKKDILNLFDVDEQKVVNTYQSVRIPNKFISIEKEEISEDIKSSYDLDYGNYILFFGAIEPKKNISRLIQAYLSSGVEIPMVIVGKKAWKSEEELKFLEEQFSRFEVIKGNKVYKRDRVIFINYVPFNMLVSLVRGARFVTFPSLYEGFGLPVVEAMLCGTPVLTSNAGSLPEVAGNAALLVDPYDVRDIKQGIQCLARSSEKRAELSEKGRKRADFFSSMPRKLLQKAYNRVIQSK